jgi:hypothetical protein
MGPDAAEWRLTSVGIGGHVCRRRAGSAWLPFRHETAGLHCNQQLRDGPKQGCSILQCPLRGLVAQPRSPVQGVGASTQAERGSSHAGCSCICVLCCCSMRLWRCVWAPRRGRFEVRAVAAAPHLRGTALQGSSSPPASTALERRHTTAPERPSKPTHHGDAGRQMIATSRAASFGAALLPLVLLAAVLSAPAHGYYVPGTYPAEFRIGDSLSGELERGPVDRSPAAAATAVPAAPRTSSSPSEGEPMAGGPQPCAHVICCLRQGKVGSRSCPALPDSARRAFGGWPSRRPQYTSAR